MRRLILPVLVLPWLQVTVPDPVPEPLPANVHVAPAGTAVDDEARTPGYVAMDVVAVAHLRSGPTVLLADRSRTTLLPIAVGDSEALAIEKRLGTAKMDRPLATELLDGVLRELGGKVDRVRVRRIDHGRFVATIDVTAGDRTVELDARASDAIALALGQRVVVEVAKTVLRDAAWTAEDRLEEPMIGEGLRLDQHRRIERGAW